MKVSKIFFIMSIFCLNFVSTSMYGNCCDSTTRIGSCSGDECSHCTNKYVPRKCQTSKQVKGPTLLNSNCTPVLGVSPDDGVCPQAPCMDGSHSSSDHKCDSTGAKLPAPTLANLCIDPTC